MKENIVLALYTLTFIGIIGSMGAWEQGNISFIQCLIQMSIMGVIGYGTYVIAKQEHIIIGKS